MHEACIGVRPRVSCARAGGIICLREHESAACTCVAELRLLRNALFHGRFEAVRVVEQFLELLAREVARANTNGGHKRRCPQHPLRVRAHDQRRRAATHEGADNTAAKVATYFAAAAAASASAFAARHERLVHVRPCALVPIWEHKLHLNALPNVHARVHSCVQTQDGLNPSLPPLLAKHFCAYRKHTAAHSIIITTISIAITIAIAAASVFDVATTPRKRPRHRVELLASERHLSNRRLRQPGGEFGNFSIFTPARPQQPAMSKRATRVAGRRRVRFPKAFALVHATRVAAQLHRPQRDVLPHLLHRSDLVTDANHQGHFERAHGRVGPLVLAVVRYVATSLISPSDVDRGRERRGEGLCAVNIDRTAAGGECLEFGKPGEPVCKRVGAGVTEAIKRKVKARQAAASVL
eukprot:40221-Pleurochrysis_carterae.AAC.1